MKEKERMQNPGYNVFFTSDLHFQHKNIIKHCPRRFEVMGLESEEELQKHNQWLISQWNSQVDKKDHVYIIGDFSFANVEWTQKIMGKLNGKKYLMYGNHDKTCERVEMQNYFVKTCQMKESIFKKNQWGFLEEDFMVFMCHYRMLVWPQKHYGCVLVHGHSHGRLDEYNAASTDLAVDVGIDSSFANYRLVSLEEVYQFFKKKTNGETFRRYAITMKEQNAMTI